MGWYPLPSGEVIEAIDPSLKHNVERLSQDSVQELLKGKEISKITPYFGGGEIIWGGSPFYEEEQVKGGMVAGYYVPQNLVAKMEDISKAFVDYRHSKILQKPLTTNYIIIFLLITLVIIFSATWFGFRLAKELTVPIMELADGTRRVASGDLDFRIGIEAEDEIGTLVSAFNTMTHDLKTGKAQLEKSNIALQRTNLELERRRKYMEIVLENVAAGVISFDKEGRITTINKSAERMLEIKAEDILGENYRKVMQPAYRKIARELIKEINTSRS